MGCALSRRPTDCGDGPEGSQAGPRLSPLSFAGHCGFDTEHFRNALYLEDFFRGLLLHGKLHYSPKFI